MRPRSAFPLCLSALVLLGLAACGGSSTKTLTKAELIAKGDAICRSSDSKLAALKRPSKSAQLPGFLNNLKSLEQDVGNMVGALVPPASLKKSFSAYRAALAQGIGITQQLIDAASKKDDAKFNLAQVKLDGLTTKVRAAARAVGFQACGSA